jgi:hypothetical protein
VPWLTRDPSIPRAAFGTIVRLGRSDAAQAAQVTAARAACRAAVVERAGNGPEAALGELGFSATSAAINPSICSSRSSSVLSALKNVSRIFLTRRS